MAPDSHTLTVPLTGTSPEEFETQAAQAVTSYFADVTDVHWSVSVEWDASSGPPCFRGTLLAVRRKTGRVNGR